jgi:hypothetical protein
MHAERHGHGQENDIPQAVTAQYRYEQQITDIQERPRYKAAENERTRENNNRVFNLGKNPDYTITRQYAD